MGYFALNFTVVDNMYTTATYSNDTINSRLFYLSADLFSPYNEQYIFIQHKIYCKEKTKKCN